MTNHVPIVNAAALELREHAGSQATKALFNWCEAAINSYKADLVFVMPENLKELQAKIKQLEAIKQIVFGNIPTNGLV